MGLRSIGCEISEDIKSAAQFEAGLLVHALSKCLHRIDEEKYSKIPLKLPKSIAKKVQVGTLISNAFKSLNYRAEIGYDKIIYPNEKDTRYLLRFLVGKLPKTTTKKNEMDDDEEDDVDVHGMEELDVRIHSSLKNWM